MKKQKKLLNRYHNQSEQLINQSCNNQIKSLGTDNSIMIVLELFDIKVKSRATDYEIINIYKEY